MSGGKIVLIVLAALLAGLLAIAGYAFLVQLSTAT